MDKKYLLVDIGNTNSKFWIYDKKKDSALFFLIPTNEDVQNFETIIENKIDFKTIDKCYYSTVFHNNAINIINLLKSKNISLNNVADNYENKEIGADIQLGVNAVIKKYYKNNFIVADLGTATTITLVENNKIIGVNIYPGFKATINSLKATNLDFKASFHLRKEKIGTNTNDSIEIGAINGYCRWIENEIFFINEKKYPVYITGGDFDIIQNQNFIKDSNLIFESLKLLCL